MSRNASNILRMLMLMSNLLIKGIHGRDGLFEIVQQAVCVSYLTETWLASIRC